MAFQSPPVDDPDSFEHTKRWYKKHPELGPPGYIEAEPFVSEEQYERELQLLWPRVWLMVGRVEEIPQAGDYIVKEIPANKVSLVIVRGRDGEVRAFHNVCPHRGSQLCFEESGERGSSISFTCPYHGFNFDLKGNLIFIPDEGNFYDLDKSKIKLNQVPSDIWAGFIFVHLDPNPRESLREFLGAEIVEGAEDYPFHEQTEYREYRGIINCSWKVLLGGFLEGYHARALHARTVDRVEPKVNPFGRTVAIKMFEKHRLIEFFTAPDRRPTRLGSIAYARYDKVVKARAAASLAAPEAPGDVAAYREHNKQLVVRNIFPNFQLNLIRGTWFRHQYWPLSRDRVLWDVRLYNPRPRNATDRFYQDYGLFASRDNLLEDAFASEKSQPALEAGLVKGWILSDEEVAIQHFMKVVADYTGQQPARAAAE